MSDAITAVLLDETKAYWIDSASMGLLPDKSLVREWRNIPVEHREACMAVLRARRAYTNPKTQTKEHTGLYRIQKIEDSITKDSAGRILYCSIRETMAYGLATTLVGEYARLVATEDLPSTTKDHPVSPAHADATSEVEQPYQTVTMRWINLDPQHMQSIVSERSALTASTLEVAGETLTGPYYLLSRKPSWAEDGSGVYEEKWGMAGFVLESYGKKGDMETSADRLITNVPKDMVKAVCDAEVAALGANYGYPGFTYEQRIKWGTDSAEIQTFSVDTPGKDVTRKAEVASAYRVDIHTYKHAHELPDADSIAGHTFGQGKTMEVDGDITDDGDFDYKHRVRTAIKQEIASHTEQIDGSVTVSRQSGKNLYDADIYDSSVALAEIGKIKRLDKSRNDDGTYNEVLTTEVATKQEWSGSYSTKYGTAYWWKGKALTSAEYAAKFTGNPATIVLDETTSNSVEVYRRADDLYDYTITKIPIREGATTIPGWTIGYQGTLRVYGEDEFKQARSGRWKKRANQYDKYWYQGSSYGTCLDWLGGETFTGMTLLASSPAGNTEVKPLANGQYWAQAVVVTYGTWEDVTDLNT